MRYKMRGATHKAVCGRNWKGKIRVAGLAVLALAFGIAGGAARAQSNSPAPPSDAVPPPPGPPFGGPGFHPHGGWGGPGMFGALGFEGFEGWVGGKTVTGAPFSATFSTQSMQSLSDGDQIQHSASGTLARDSQGRTRRDMTFPAIGPWAADSGQPAPHGVFINDPVGGTGYVLQPNQKIARKIQIPPHAGHYRGGPRTGQFRPRPPRRGMAGQENQRDVVTTPLGAQTINGVLAEGTRYTRTIPAGAIGNDKPIAITTEQWYSSELQTFVMTKRSDPRMGETASQLTNIQRQEPDASLFQVPSDYTVVQQGGPAGMRRRWGMRGHQPPPGNGAAQPPPPQD